jgi:MoxR-like ATPase
MDEIDKADPDVPNNLLVVLGSFEFPVEETGSKVRRTPSASSEKTSRQLVIFTTNEERDLPDAFLRRCVVHWLESPGAARLVEIADRHFTSEMVTRSQPAKGGRADAPKDFGELARGLAERVEALAAEANDLGLRPPSTAEYLDALRACLALGVDVASPEWKHIEKAALRKPRKLEADEPPAG